MPKCDLQIVFDRPDGEFVLGEKISGRVDIMVEEACKYRKLTLIPTWIISGEGGYDMGKGDGQEFPEGTWDAGKSASIPFEILSPAGPLTYHGNLFSLDWWLMAQADITLSPDAFAKMPFVLAARQSEGPADPSQKTPYNPFHETPWSVSHLVLVLIFSLIPLALGGLFFEFFVGDMVTRDRILDTFGWGFLVFSGVMALAGCVLVVIGVRQWVRRRRRSGGAIASRPAGSVDKNLHPKTKYWKGQMGFGFSRSLLSWLHRAVGYWRVGRVKVQLSPEAARRGNEVHCSVRFRPRSAVQLAEATAVLDAHEVVERQEGRQREIKSSLRHEERVALAVNRSLLPMEEVILHATLCVPSESPPTFVASSNQLVWFITVELKLTGWPDWRLELPLVVSP